MTTNKDLEKARYEGEIYASIKVHKKISEYLHDLQAETFAAGYAAGFEAGLKARLPSEDEVRVKAVEICASIPETVTQQAAKERATKAFYDWLAESMRKGD